MRPVFYPESIAVIGVSTSADNMGLGIMYNLSEFGFKGTIYPVGIKGGELGGKTIYPSVLNIPGQVDLAVILTPARTVASILDDCGRKGIRWAVVESSGFREYREEGKRFENDMLRSAEKWGMRFIGPNCIGVINIENGLCTPFTPLKPMVRRGDISIISQSGGVGMSVLNLMGNEGLGLNKFVSAGNMLNIQTEEFLEYLIQDPSTNYIYLHLEGIQNGRKLMETARRSPKPILISKANIGRLGKSIASSHTASLSSNDKVVEAAFRQSGIIRINDGTTLGNDLKILHLPPMRGRNLAIISRSGGHAVIAADVCELVGLNLAPFPQEFIREIEKHFRASVIKLTNPLDLGDLFDSDFFLYIIERTLTQEGVDGLVFLHTIIPVIEGPKSRELLSRVSELSRQYQKPVAVYVSTEDQEVAWLKRNLNFPIFTQIVETIRALDLNRRYYSEIGPIHQPLTIDSFPVDLDKARSLIERVAEEKRDPFLHEAAEIFNLYDIPLVRGLPVRSKDEAVQAARESGFPVALKIISRDISHKSDVGGVQLNLRTET
ncbi:MAG: CoA-binding protein, partial [Thermodesulfobacteriota bacterium]